MDDQSATPSADIPQVLLAAGDTFRAAAAEQLQTWAERSGASFYGPKRERHRPDALMYEVRQLRHPHAYMLPRVARAYRASRGLLGIHPYPLTSAV